LRARVLPPLKLCLNLDVDALSVEIIHAILNQREATVLEIGSIE